MQGLTWLQKTLIVQNGEAIDEEEDRLQEENPVSYVSIASCLSSVQQQTHDKSPRVHTRQAHNKSEQQRGGQPAEESTNSWKLQPHHRAQATIVTHACTYKIGGAETRYTSALTLIGQFARESCVAAIC